MTKNLVILLHGLSLNSLSMKFIQSALEKEQYITVYIDYPSRGYPLKKLALEYIKPVLDENSNFTSINFVTHSIGGVVLKYLLNTMVIHNLGRVVMLCPPNKGSELVNFFEFNKFLRWYLGPAWLELKTQNKEIELKKQLRSKIGIIMGNKIIEPFLSRELPLPNDGIVSLESTKIPDSSECVISCNHLNILWNKLAIKQIISFLKNGEFQK